MKKIAFWGYESHKKTGSTDFLINLLNKKYEVDILWSLPNSHKYDGNHQKLINQNYHAIVIFQIFPAISDLKLLKCPNIILVPMYDNDLTITYSTWSNYHAYKFISFSKILNSKLNFLGIQNNLYQQYAPKNSSIKIKSNRKKPKIFFWQRCSQINWKLIKKLIDLNQVDSIHFHRIKPIVIRDEWFEEPTQKDIIKYNITFSSWFESKNDLVVTMNECDIFISPRIYEGIGHAFLEAMSFGKCVISTDYPTMNEYITHGENGLLFDFKSPQRLNISDYKTIGKNAKKHMKFLRKKWNKNKSQIFSFIDKSISVCQKNTKFKSNLDKLTKTGIFQKIPFLYEDLKLYDTSYKTKSKSIEFSKFLNLLRFYLNHIKTQHRNFIIYGAGTGAELILNIIPEKICYIVDLDETKQGKTILNKKICSLEQLKNNDKPILVSVFGRFEAILHFLTYEHLVERKRLISLDL
jgi:glycosyltransferase involved in cell wall biosynthesis